ncbi:MAG: type II toxin-antitoxin system VapC family toxin [Actinomycetota bacterium]
MTQARLLLDTHVVLWLLSSSRRVPPEVVADCVDPRNEVAVSAVVPWEVAIKRARGKLQAPPDLVDMIGRAGLTPLPISLEHGAAVEALPPLHRDPFDRMLIAQAQVERLTLVTADRRLGDYEVGLRLI